MTRAVAPVRRQVAANLRRAIFEGRFRPGDRLIERELCALTGTSRSSIREALRQLESEGLIVTEPNRGPVVRTMSAAEAEDLYQVRAVLEALAGKLFAMRATDQAVETLSTAVDRLEAAFESGENGAALRALDAFYDVLLGNCGSQAIESMLQSLHNRVAVLRAAALRQSDRPAQSLAELRRIVTAIRSRDLEAAAQACTEHVERAAAIALRTLDRPSGAATTNQATP